MRTVVIPHEEVVAKLRAWRQTLGSTKAERDRRYTELWAEFVREIVAAGGPPRDAIQVASQRPPSYWCGFPGGGFARIVVAPPRRVGLWRTERRVIVLDLMFSPDLPG